MFDFAFHRVHHSVNLISVIPRVLNMLPSSINLFCCSSVENQDAPAQPETRSMILPLFLQMVSNSTFIGSAMLVGHKLPKEREERTASFSKYVTQRKEFEVTITAPEEVGDDICSNFVVIAATDDYQDQRTDYTTIVAFAKVDI